jgi:hypothetical protein
MCNALLALYEARMKELRGLHGWQEGGHAVPPPLAVMFASMRIAPLRRLYSWSAPYCSLQQSPYVERASVHTRSPAPQSAERWAFWGRCQGGTQRAGDHHNPKLLPQRCGGGGRWVRAYKPVRVYTLEAGRPPLVSDIAPR